MGTNSIDSIHADTITELTKARDRALRAVRDLAKQLRILRVDSPLEPRIETALCEAMDVHGAAENALRLAESGYEETYTHPAGGVHPTDAYSCTLSRRG